MKFKGSFSRNGTARLGRIGLVRRRFRRGRGDHRAMAGAIVEFAVVLPLLLTILFGIIEYGWVFMVRQTMQHAAREGCRLAVLQTSVEPYGNVVARVNDIMASANLSGYSITMTHATNADPVETVSVSIPYSQVSLVGGFFGTANYDLTGTCSMRKEGMDES
jgi:Flp pilus assembly protein TadG